MVSTEFQQFYTYFHKKKNRSLKFHCGSLKILETSLYLHNGQIILTILIGVILRMYRDLSSTNNCLFNGTEFWKHFLYEFFVYVEGESDS